MTANNFLRLDNLMLRNFRCFVECAIDLHPNLTVLVAENGQGKSSILDAIGIAMRLFVDALADVRPFYGFERTDVHLIRSPNGTMSPAPFTDFAATGIVNGMDMKWSRTLRTPSPRPETPADGKKMRSQPARTSTAMAKTLQQQAIALREAAQLASVDNGPQAVILPLVVSYGTGRLWNESRLAEGRRSRFTASDDRFSGYRDCLSSSSSFKGMAAWFEMKNTELGDSRHTMNVASNLSLLGAVQAAVRLVLEPTRWCDVVWDRAQRCLVVEHAIHGRLPLAALSDGVRNMIALVADVARRCATLNPHLDDQAARQTPGVLLIDEIDMHLHPRWQQLVVDLLQRAFPAMQIILSTHSPHVLSTVEFNSIRIVGFGEDGIARIKMPQFQTLGVESADVLAEVMNVDTIPPVDQAGWLSEYRALVETSNTESPAAQALWAKLVEHFGRQHPVMAEVEVLRRLQQFRHSHNLSPQSGK